MVTTLSFKMKKISRRLHEKGPDCMKKFRESIREHSSKIINFKKKKMKTGII